MRCRLVSLLTHLTSPRSTTRRTAAHRKTSFSLVLHRPHKQKKCRQNAAGFFVSRPLLFLALEKIHNSATQHPFDAHISLRSPSIKRFGAQHRPALSIEIPHQSCESELKKMAAAASVKHSSLSSSPRLRQILSLIHIPSPRD